MTTPQSPDRNAAADVLIQRVRNNIEAHRKSLPDDWQDFIAEQVRDINAALAALRAGGEPVAWELRLYDYKPRFTADEREVNMLAAQAGYTIRPLIYADTAKGKTE
jgi:hypothetical protein